MNDIHHPAKRSSLNYFCPCSWKHISPSLLEEGERAGTPEGGALQQNSDDIYGLLQDGIICLSLLRCYSSKILFQRRWLREAISDVGCEKGFAVVLQSAGPGSAKARGEKQYGKVWIWIPPAAQRTPGMYPKCSHDHCVFFRARPVRARLQDQAVLH